MHKRALEHDPDRTLGDTAEDYLSRCEMTPASRSGWGAARCSTCATSPL
jgi:hypothetical protein